jgi:hypothetical protein
MKAIVRQISDRTVEIRVDAHTYRVTAHETDKLAEFFANVASKPETSTWSEYLTSKGMQFVKAL